MSHPNNPLAKAGEIAKDYIAAIEAKMTEIIKDVLGNGHNLLTDAQKRNILQTMAVALQEGKTISELEQMFNPENVETVAFYTADDDGQVSKQEVAVTALAGLYQGDENRQATLDAQNLSAHKLGDFHMINMFKGGTPLTISEMDAGGPKGPQSNRYNDNLPESFKSYRDAEIMLCDAADIKPAPYETKSQEDYDAIIENVINTSAFELAEEEVLIKESFNQSLESLELKDLTPKKPMDIKAQFGDGALDLKEVPVYQAEKQKGGIFRKIFGPKH